MFWVTLPSFGLLSFHEWGFISCRWRYWSWIIARSVCHNSNIVFMKQNKRVFIQDKCYHLMLCLQLIKPECTFFKVIEPCFKMKGVQKFSIPFFYQRKGTKSCMKMKANARIKKTVLHCENIWATFLISCCFIHSFSHNFCVLSMSVHVSRDRVALIKKCTNHNMEAYMKHVWRLNWMSSSTLIFQLKRNHIEYNQDREAKNRFKFGNFFYILIIKLAVLEYCDHTSQGVSCQESYLTSLPPNRCFS